MKINKHQCGSRKINEHEWKSMKINEHLLNSMKISVFFVLSIFVIFVKIIKNYYKPQSLFFWSGIINNHMFSVLF